MGEATDLGQLCDAQGWWKYTPEHEHESMGGLRNVELSPKGSRDGYEYEAHLDVFLVQCVELVNAGCVEDFELKLTDRPKSMFFFQERIRTEYVAPSTWLEYS